MDNKTLPSDASANINYNLLSHISHEVKGPFNGLIGFSDILNTHYETISDDSKKEYIHIINQLAAKSFLQLQTLLIWLKLISNNLTLNFSTIDLYDGIKNSISGLSNEIDQKKINFVYPIKNTTIDADNQLLIVALSNILATSIRTLNESNEITITHQIGNEEHCICLSWVTTDELFAPLLPFLQNVNTYDEHSFRLWIASQIMKTHRGKLSFTIDNNLVSTKIFIPTKSTK